MTLPYPCVLIHHRLPAICCALLCTGAMILSINSATTCQFLKIKYDNTPHSPLENFDNVPIIEKPIFDPRYHHRSNNQENDNDNRNTYSETHDIGLFCNSVQYEPDLMWKVSRGFTFASLAIVTICTITSWMITSFFKASTTSWKLLSILTLSAAGIETPIFLFFTTKTCQPQQQQQINGGECAAGEGFFMLLWSIILLG